MDKLHRYALDEQGNTIFIGNIAKEARHNKFYCKNCGGIMIPVLGKRRKKHFRHKVITPSCSYESYIHKIGKEKLKNRFYQQESFIASYYLEYTCNKTNSCKFKEKLANLKCNNREKRTIDLKQLYDTCEDEKNYKGFKADLMLSHSKHPEREPIFIEIAYTHDCTPKKLNSGIKIIEVKVKDDQDFSMPFEEPNLLFLNFDDNDPYTYYNAPPVRFYNFPRHKPISIPLSRFVVIKTKEGTIEGFNIPQKTTCQAFEYEHLHSIAYEFVTSEEIIVQDKINLYAFGLAMAMKKGYPVKHCVFCKWFYQGRGGCVVNGIQEYKYLNTNQSYKFPVKLWNRSLNPELINRAEMAAKCNIFALDLAQVDKILNYYKNVPFWDWENKIIIDSW